MYNGKLILINIMNIMNNVLFDKYKINYDIFYYKCC